MKLWKSSGSIRYSSSFSITRPRYFICLSLFLAAAILSWINLFMSLIPTWQAGERVLSIKFDYFWAESGTYVSFIEFIPDAAALDTGESISSVLLKTSKLSVFMVLGMPTLDIIV